MGGLLLDRALHPCDGQLPHLRSPPALGHGRPTHPAPCARHRLLRAVGSGGGAAAGCRLRHGAVHAESVHASDIGWPHDLFSLARDVVNEEMSSSVITFSGYDPGYESRLFPGTFDPLRARRVAPLQCTRGRTRCIPSCSHFGRERPAPGGSRPVSGRGHRRVGAVVAGRGRRLPHAGHTARGIDRIAQEDLCSRGAQRARKCLPAGHWECRRGPRACIGLSAPFGGRRVERSPDPDGIRRIDRGTEEMTDMTGGSCTSAA